MILENPPRVKPERLLTAPWNLIPVDWYLALRVVSTSFDSVLHCPLQTADCRLAANAALCLSMYLSLFVRM